MSDSFEELLRQVAGAPAATVESVAPWLGKVIAGRFEVLRVLGRGSYGIVYEARDLHLGRHVAIKALRAGQWDVAHWQAEAAAIARLNQPNIVTLFDSGFAEGLPYLVMELLRGITLQQRLAHGPMEPREVSDLALQLARGLAHAHQAGLVHRDLKPANVMLCENGAAKLLDLGLARATAELERLSVEGLRGHSGSPAFMSPEQLGGEKIDARSDVYAFGRILQCALAGEGDPGVAAARPPPREGPVTALMARCLSDDRSARPRDGGQLVEALQRADRGLAEGESPYRYLEPFAEADEAVFYGRETDLRRVEQIVLHRPLTVLAGPSGAGKTSVVMGGFVPRFRARRERGEVLALRPGRDPIEALSERLSLWLGRELPAADIRARPGLVGASLRREASLRRQALLLFVDQLEEIFTVGDEAAPFLSALASAGDDPVSPLRVLLAVRDDFLARILPFIDLNDPRTVALVMLPRPADAALVEALVSPARTNGVEFEAGVAEEMVAALRDQAAPLPTLQLAASRLWETRDREGRCITRGALQALGGIPGVLAAHADSVVDGLVDPEARVLAQQLLTRLVTAEGTRRQISREELLAGFPPVALKVLTHLIDGRLLTTSRGREGETVELAHEALLQRWDRLRSFMGADRERARWLERATRAAEHWRDLGRPASLLWRGEALEEALRFLRAPGGPLPPLTRDFIDSAVAVRDAATRRRARVRNGSLAGLVLVAAAALAGGLFYRAEARKARLGALLRKAAAEADPLRGALLFLAVAGDQEPPGGLAAAAALAQRRIPLAAEVFADSVNSVAFSPDGDRVAAVADDGMAGIFPTDGRGEAVRVKAHPDHALAVAFRGRDQVMTAGREGTVRVFSSRGEVLRSTSCGGAGTGLARFSRDAGLVLMMGEEDSAVWLCATDGSFRRPLGACQRSALEFPKLSLSGDRIGLLMHEGPLRVVDAQDRLQFEVQPEPPGISQFEFSADGAQVAVGFRNGKVSLVRDGRQAVAMTIEGRVYKLVFSPDGSRLAAGNGEGVVWLFDTRSGKELAVLRGHRSVVTTIAFSADGSRIATTGRENYALLHDEDGAAPARLEGHQNTVYGAVFSPDGSRLATLSGDGTFRIWSTGELPAVHRVQAPGELIWDLEFSPDGVSYAAPTLSGRIYVGREGSPLRQILSPPLPTRIHFLRFHPDGNRIVMVDHEARLRLASVDGSVPQQELFSGKFHLVFDASLDGRWVAAGVDARRILLFPFGSRVPVREWAWPGDRIESIVFSADSRSLLITGGTLVWFLPIDGGPPVVLSTLSKAIVAWPVPTTDLVVTGEMAGPARFWRPDGAELPALRRGNGGVVRVGPDGRTIAWAEGMDVAVAPLQGGEPALLRGHTGVIVTLAFDGRGERLASASVDGVARIWHIRWHDLLQSLRASTSACLSIRDRVSLLDESDAEAASAFLSCERSNGRSGAAQP